MANVEVVGQTSAMTQTFHHQEVKTERSERFDLKTPEGDLGDVEADFQSLVNEMAKDSSIRSSYKGSTQSFSSSKVVQESSISSSKVTKQSFSSNSSNNMISTNINGSVGAPRLTQVPAGPPKEPPPPPPPTAPSDNGLVTAFLAQVIPDDGPIVVSSGGGETESVVEQPMRVRDRVKKLEKQLSTEDISAGPPEMIMPRHRSGSVRNLAEQFSHVDETSHPPPPPSINAAAFKNIKNSASTESIDTDASKTIVTGEFRSVKDIVNTFSKHEETTSVKKVEGEFKSVRETASIFQDPIQPMTPPIRPPPAFITEGETPEATYVVEAVEPVAVLPPATMKRNPPLVPPPKVPAPVIPTPQIMPLTDSAPVACLSPP